MMGLTGGADDDEGLPWGDDDGRRLVGTADTIDHAASGKVFAVKDQGRCGSCWAFAANTALEGAVAINGNTTPVHLSEQQLVSCTTRSAAKIIGTNYGNGGCNGGWMDYAWDFQRDHGAMLDADYPYVSGNDGRTRRCKHNSSKTVGNVSTYGAVTTIADMKAKLVTHPLTIAIDASSYGFQYYKSGVLQANQCTTGLNHAVVVVGYSEGSNYWKIQNSWGTGWGDQGFILFEITSGLGVCAMNRYVWWAQMH